jgi:hypothetical protein
MVNTGRLFSEQRERLLRIRLRWAERFSAKSVENGSVIKKMKEVDKTQPPSFLATDPQETPPDLTL